MESVEAWRLTGDLHVEHGKADVADRIENQQRIELQRECFEEEALKRTLKLDAGVH